MHEDEELIARCLRAMRHGPESLRGHQRLTGAASGAGVHRLVFGDGRVAVLKVTTTPALNDRARREFWFYQALAAQLPVRTPRLLAAADTADLTCLLLSAAEPTPPPERWAPREWIAAAGELGALHHPSVASGSDRYTWLNRPRRVTSTEVATALTAWRQLGLDSVAGPLLDQLEQLDGAIAELPVCLLHGDWHAGNLLLNQAGLVWADWQEVGVGHGPEDLTLLWQRAEFDGARPPREAMLDAYVRARGIRPDVVLEQAILAAEIRLLLLGWPTHLLHAAPAERQDLLDRLEHLSRRWVAEVARAGA